MTITLVGGGTKYEAIGASTGTAVPVLPAILGGDLILAHYFCRVDSTNAFATPTDFTLVKSRSTGAGTSGTHFLFRKIAVSDADADPSSAWTSGATNATTIANVAVFRSSLGFHATVPVLDIPTAFSAGTSSDLGPIAGMTPSAGAGGVVIFGGMSNDPGATALGAPWEAVYDSPSALGTDGEILCEWQPWTSGAVGDATWVVPGTVNWSGIMISLQEAAAAAGQATRTMHQARMRRAA